MHERTTNFSIKTIGFFRDRVCQNIFLEVRRAAIHVERTGTCVHLQLVNGVGWDKNSNKHIVRDERTKTPTLSIRQIR